MIDRLLVVGCCAVLAWAGQSVAGEPQAKAKQGDAWAAWSVLVGEWKASGGGAPGQASGGSFSFTPDLDGRVLLRRSRSSYPASNGRPAFTHQDLMVVFHDGEATRAQYFDNEGHVIDYAVTVAPGGKQFVFVSDAKAGQPRFRITYDVAADGSAKVAFAVASPPTPDAFKEYVSGTATRVAPKKHR